MKSRSFSYNTLAVICALSNMLFFAASLMVFRQKDHEIKTIPLLLFVAACIVFVILVAFLLSRRGKILGSDLSGNQTRNDRNATDLLKAGVLPLKSLIIYILLMIAYVLSLSFLLPSLGLMQTQMFAFRLYMLSSGFLCGGLVFVLSDKIVTRTLLASHIVYYPAHVRDSRQFRKVIIIPVFICVISIMYAVSVVMLYNENIVSILIAASILFFMTIVVLVFNWGKVLALVYQSIIRQLDQLASAEKDLKRRISIASVDELGSISGLVNDFCDGLAGSLVRVKSAQADLSHLGEELCHNAETAASAVNRIARNISTVRDESGEQAKSVSGSASAVEEIARSIGSLEAIIGDQAASVTQASTSIEEMISSIGSVTASISRMAGRFTDLLQAAREGSAAQAESIRKIEQIASGSKSLMEANHVIATIASQTNLLAMNAAIEAAHAGNAGRGFSVVADEIRKLAETSAGQTKKIGTEIKNVQKAIEEVVASSRNTEAVFGRVSEHIADTDALVREVHQAMIEQKEGSTEILDALTTMNEITTLVRDSSSEMSTGTGTVLDEIVRLRTSTDKIISLIGSISEGSGEIAESTKNVSAMAEKTAENILILEKAVSGFIT